jgi:hypothetical protein
VLLDGRVSQVVLDLEVILVARAIQVYGDILELKGEIQVYKELQDLLGLQD